MPLPKIAHFSTVGSRTALCGVRKPEDAHRIDHPALAPMPKGVRKCDKCSRRLSLLGVTRSMIAPDDSSFVSTEVTFAVRDAEGKPIGASDLYEIFRSRAEAMKYVRVINRSKRFACAAVRPVSVVKVTLVPA